MVARRLSTLRVHPHPDVRAAGPAIGARRDAELARRVPVHEEARGLGRAHLHDAPLRDRARLPHAGVRGSRRQARRRRRRVHDHGGRGARGADAPAPGSDMVRGLASDMGHEPAAIDWIAQARSVAPLIAANADRMERERALTDEVLAALHEAKLFRLLLPRSCGGAELEPAVYVQAVEEI